MGKLMSLKVAERAQILERMTAGKISQTEAARRIGVTVRQVNRLDKHYRAFGLAGLISKKRGRIPNNSIGPAVLARATPISARRWRPRNCASNTHSPFRLKPCANR
jgi:hypothetical protein